jgi:site-specific DNA recombinase
MTKRAILYSRVSGDDTRRDGRNVRSQLDMCREYALSRKYLIAAELHEDDHGASGAAFELPQLSQIREMAQRHEFDVLIVREIDRLSRSLAKQLVVEEQLKRDGVQIEYVMGEYPDTPEGNLNKNIKAVIAEYEREKITERMLRGRELKAKGGSILPNGCAPFGYRVIQRDGNFLLEIQDDEAAIVRMIYDWYIVGSVEDEPLSINEISRRLTALGIPTPADRRDYHSNSRRKRGPGQWEPSSIAHLLNRETYAGVWHYRRETTVDGKQQTTIPVAVPAIVTREIWDAAQARLLYNMEHSSRNRKYDYLLAGRVRCAECGYKMEGTSCRPRPDKLYLYYRCKSGSAARNLSTCRARRFNMGMTDAAVWNWVISFLTDPVALRNGLAAYRSERDRDVEPIQRRIGVVEDLLAQTRPQLERLLDLYVTGGVTKDMLVDRKARLETTIGALEKEREGLLAQLKTQQLSDEQLDSIEGFAAQVAQGLAQAEESFATRRRVIEMLDLQVSLSHEGETPVVDVQCKLGSKNLHVASTATYGRR